MLVRVQSFEASPVLNIQRVSQPLQVQRRRTSTEADAEVMTLMATEVWMRIVRCEYRLLVVSGTDDASAGGCRAAVVKGEG